MGRAKRSRFTWPPAKKTHKLRLKTKKHFSNMPRVASYGCPDIPVKVRRSLARRAAEAATRPGVRPICFLQETALSRLYDEKAPESYMEQVFSYIEKVGQGCFGDVFKALSKEDSKLYAVKVTNDTHSFIDLGEVRRMEKVPEHKNCVKFYSAWQESYRLYIQMELCMTSLDKLLMIDHFIREPQCWDILTDIAEGLKNLHDHELIHLDIKPANIMISSEGICKLGDFGLLVDLTEINAKTSDRKRTGLSVSEGDGKYVAIEVLQANTYTKAGDIFSLGLMMLEVASDAILPSSGTDWENIRAGILPHCYKRRKLSRKFRHLISSMIQKDHTRRPSVDDILKNTAVVKTMEKHQDGERVNYVSNWVDVWQHFLTAHPQLDLAMGQIEGPSPPMRAYPIYYVPPISPVRTPLAQLEPHNTTPEVSNPGSANGEQQFDRTRRISRRLFF